MEIIYLVCFFCIIVVAVVLLLRDTYIQKDCENRVKEITDKINEVNRFKYNADKSQFNRLTELEDTVDYVEANYVRKDDMSKGVITDNLVAKNIKTSSATINEAEIQGSLHSKGFGMVDPNGDGEATEQCVTLEEFYNSPLMEGFVDAPKDAKKQPEEGVMGEPRFPQTKAELKAQGLVAQGYDLSVKEGVDVQNMDVLSFSASQAKMKYATLDDGYFKTFSSGTGNFDNVKAKGGVFDKMTTGELTGQNGVLNNMMINDSTLKNARWESGTADKMTVNSLKAGNLEATKTKTNTLYTPQGEVVNLKSDKAEIDTVLSNSAVLDNIKSKKMTSDELISKYVTTTDRLKAPLGEFDGVSSKRVNSTEVTGDTGTFKSIFADVARVDGKISASDKICVNNACLDTEMIDLINKNPPGGINNEAFFKGGLSELNPKNDGTRFPDADGRNYIRGDTSVDGHAKFAGNLEVNGKIKMSKANPGAMIESQIGVNQADRYGIGQFPGGNMRTYASSATAQPSTVSMSFARNDGSFNDVLTVTNDNVATVNGRLDMYNAADKGRMSFGVSAEKRGIISEGDKDFNIYTNNKKAFTVTNGGSTKTPGDIMMNGGNNWAFQAPSDGDSLNIAPSIQRGAENWNPEKVTRFQADGSIANRQGKMYLGDNLGRGSTLYFGGTQNNNTHDATVIENKERSGGNLGSELLIFKGGDVGKDRVRVRGGEIAFDVYDSNTRDRNAESVKGKFTADGFYVDNKICFGTGANPTCFDRTDISRIKNIQGIKGDTGAQGPQGLQGAKGDRGDTGLQGLTGATGPQGVKGDTGPKGDTGARGEVGPTGPPGTMDSRSVINASGGMNSGAVINFGQGTNGPMIEKNMGGDNNRYGVGQYTNGVMRMYAAGSVPSATLNLSLAQANNTFDDVVQIRSDKAVHVNGAANFNEAAVFNKDATFKKNLCVGSTCVDETKFKTFSTGGGGADGNFNIQNKLFFKDPSMSTVPNGDNKSDPYYMEKVIDGGNASSLRMTINDDADESFQIWGNSCGTGDCGNGGAMQHKFQANGDAVHMGGVAMKGDQRFTGGNNWILHTPDDNRRTMYIAPSKAYGNEDWDWGKQVRFEADGSVNLDNGKLYAQKTTGSETEAIAEFRHSNRSEGVAIGYNTISATGDNKDQDLKLKAKGAGVVSVAGNPLVLSEYELFSKANEPVEKAGNWTLGNDWPWDPKFRGGRVGYAHTQIGDDNDSSSYWIDYTVPAGMKQAYIVHLPWSNCRYFDVMGRNGNDVIFVKRVNSWNPQPAAPNNNHSGTTAVSVAGVNRFQRIRIQCRIGQVHLMGVGWTREEGRAMETGYTHWDNIYNKPNIPDMTNPTFNQVYANDWVRPKGNSGLYFQDRGGGIHMTDNEWIRTYNGKGFYSDKEIRGAKVQSDGNINLGTNSTFQGTGRMHINSDNDLYVLNKNGMTVGKEWGGSGNLNVQGDANVNGWMTGQNVQGTDHVRTKDWTTWMRKTGDIHASNRIGIGIHPDNQGGRKLFVDGGPNNDWQTQFRHGSHAYIGHNGGYGMHINTYNNDGNKYALELHNNQKQLMAVYNNGNTNVSGELCVQGVCITGDHLRMLKGEKQLIVRSEETGRVLEQGGGASSGDQVKAYGWDGASNKRWRMYPV